MRDANAIILRPCCAAGATSPLYRAVTAELVEVTPATTSQDVNQPSLGYPLPDSREGLVTQFLIGISGALVGVIGWLLVGLFIQRRAHDRAARDAARAVYFELAANRLAIFVAEKYGSYGPISSSAYERLLPEVSTWLPASELQALVVAYLGHGGYNQAATDTDVPAEVRQAALAGLMQAHNTALKLLHRRVFSAKEAASLNEYISPEYAEMLAAADKPAQPQGRQ